MGLVLMNRAVKKAGAVAPAAGGRKAAEVASKPKRATGKAAASAGAATTAAAATVVVPNNENSENDEEDNMVTEEDQAAQMKLDVFYNPEIITSILADLEKQVQIKCSQIQKDADFMAVSIKQAFHLELIKLPTQVKQMSLARFRSEFGDSLEAVTRGAIGGRDTAFAFAPGATAWGNAAAVPSSAVKSRTSTKGGVFQTPSHRRGGGEPRMSVAQTPSSRRPREGEMLLSANGSPLGEFQTVVKAGRPGAPKIDVPATPGLFVPLQNGDVVDMENTDISSMTQDVKLDALAKMQEMMENMQALMDKLKN